MKKLELHWQILLGMVLGVLFGFIMSYTAFGSSFISDWIKPFGTIFINALKLIAMPLILGSLIKGVSDLSDSDRGIIDHLMVIIKEEMLKQGIGDYRLVINNGSEAGQTVFHLHIHVLANRTLGWPPG